MNDYEYINRFLAFYLFKIDYYGNLETFMNQCLVELNKKDFKMDVIKGEFFKAMEYSIRIFGDTRFKKTDYNSNRKARINKALFDTVSVNLAWLPIEELENLILNSNEVNLAMQKLFEDTYFNESISLSTNSKKKVEYRFDAVFQLFKKFK